MEKKIVNQLSSSKKRLWFFLNMIFTSIYLIWRFFFTIPTEYGWISLIAGVSLFVIELLGMFEAVVHFLNMHKIQTYDLPEVPADKWPDVDIFIATYNEPVDLLYKTVNGCNHLEYVDKSKIHIYLCDDGRREEVKALAKKMNVGYLDRDNNEHAKAGNLNNALSKTTSPYVVTFDADMIPKHEFLLRTIPYFIGMEMENEGKEEKDQEHMGFVQSPQVFYNPDLFQFNLFSERRIPNEQDYFYRDIQVARNKSNSVIYGGSNTVLSRSALEKIGGFFTGSITEDYGTGILMQKAGFRCYAINEPLASGLSPTDLKSLISQRIRWARGVINTNRKMHIWGTKNLKMGQKLNYWASSWYWYAPLKRLIYFLSPILFAVFGYMVIECTLWEILIFWLPMYISSNISLKMLSGNIRTTKWTGIYETVLFPYMLIPVLLETFGISMKKFMVTSKERTEREKGKNLLYLIPFAVLVVLSVIGVFNCLRVILLSGSMGPAVVLFWLLSNLFSLIMSMFFIGGRDFVRKSERMEAEENCEIITNFQTIQTKTYDISETGVSVKMNIPIDIAEGEEVKVRIWNERNDSTVKANVVHVDNKKSFWKYAFLISDQGECYEDYLEILYDRVPTLPQSLDFSSGGVDDLKINISKRATTPFYEKRLLPRVTLKVMVPDSKGKFWEIDDFNYKYLKLKTKEAPEQLELVLDKKKQLTLKLKKEPNLKLGTHIYLVENYKENRSSVSRYLALQNWLSEHNHHHMKKEAVKEVTQIKVTEKQQEHFDEMEHL